MKTSAILSLFLAALLAVAAPTPGEAGEQIVRLTAPLDQSGSAEDSAPAPGLEEARARAVFQEAESLLPGVLSKARQEVLFDFLAARTEAYVLSYARGKTEVRGALLSTTWRIGVNEALLRQTLRDWGVSFTLKATWDYSLELRVDDSGRYAETVHRLETLSGLENRGAMSPRLRLRRGGGQEATWRGLLEYEEQSWSKAGSSLEEVWLGLWPHYFRLPEVQARVLEVFRLRVQGWSSVSGVRGFDRVLRKNSGCVHQANLLQTVLSADSVAALWDVHTPDRQRLEQFLNGYLPVRGLSFGLGNKQDE